jgi:hypothetical protein
MASMNIRGKIEFVCLLEQGTKWKEVILQSQHRERFFFNKKIVIP